MRFRLAVAGLLVTAWTAFAAKEYQAGVAVADVTPDNPIRLSGYASRKTPSEGIRTRLHAKALALQRGEKERVVIVTTDVIGLPRTMTDVVAARVLKAYGLERSALLLNASHTHTGPYIKGNLPFLFELSASEKTVVDAYAERLQETLVKIVGEALKDMHPVTISVAHGEAHFGINRREATDKGIKIGVNPAGPKDPDVPVLKILEDSGKTLAVLFGYACHNTTLTGNDNEISADYAGYAQQKIEQAVPGAVAMFVMLCGADQNPEPRGTPQLAQQHGEGLGTEVVRVLGTGMTPVHGHIRSALQVTELGFRPSGQGAFSGEMTRYPYPVQALSFGTGLTVVALGGEVLVGYDLKIRREFTGQGKDVIVAGYSNDVMAYIPTLADSRLGGYEVVDSMKYYGMPGPWADDTEERILSTVRAVIKRVR